MMLSRTRVAIFLVVGIPVGCEVCDVAFGPKTFPPATTLHDTRLHSLTYFLSNLKIIRMDVVGIQTMGSEQEDGCASTYTPGHNNLKLALCARSLFSIDKNYR
ncbi:hypothetical protein BKA63DRAFT_517067 [Paraphoma chrysanthemicola]|nr:hypothetical protein BKA63DRAFT_517067 [Paraphoma chrysanthemicola]